MMAYWVCIIVLILIEFCNATCPSATIIGLRDLTAITSPLLHVEIKRPVQIRVTYGYDAPSGNPHLQDYDVFVANQRTVTLPEFALPSPNSSLVRVSVRFLDPETRQPLMCSDPHTRQAPDVHRVFHVFPLQCVTNYDDHGNCVLPIPPPDSDLWPLSFWTPTITYVYSVAMQTAFSPSASKLGEPERFRRWLSLVAFQEGGVSADVILVLDGHSSQHNALIGLIPLTISRNSRSIRIVQSSAEGLVPNPYFVGAAMSSARILTAPLLEDLSGRDFSTRLVSLFESSPPRKFLIEEIDGGGVRVVAARTSLFLGSTDDATLTHGGADDASVPDSAVDSQPCGGPYCEGVDPLEYRTGLLNTPQHIPSAGSARMPSSPELSTPPSAKEFAMSFLQVLGEGKNVCASEVDSRFFYLHQFSPSVDPFSEPLRHSFHLPGFPTLLPLSSSAAGWMMPTCLVSGLRESSNDVLTAFTTDGSVAARIGLFSDEVRNLQVRYCRAHEVATWHDVEDVMRDPGDDVSQMCAMLRVLSFEPKYEEALWMLSSQPLRYSILSATLSAMSTSARHPPDTTLPSVISHIARAGALAIHLGGSTCARDGVTLILAALAMAAPGQASPDRTLPPFTTTTTSTSTTTTTTTTT
eukprot:Rmarinus@m.7475